jgi:small Trp-rich protein
MNIIGLLGVLFIALKLLEITVVASWSWWLVLLPFYGGLLFFLVVFLLGVTGIIGSSVLGSTLKTRRRFR